MTNSTAKVSTNPTRIVPAEPTEEMMMPIEQLIYSVARFENTSLREAREHFEGFADLQLKRALANAPLGGTVSQEQMDEINKVLQRVRTGGLLGGAAHIVAILGLSVEGEN